MIVKFPKTSKFSVLGRMKEIKFTKGYVALVDDEDYDRVVVAGMGAAV